MTGVDLSPRRGWRACSSGWMLRVEQVAAHIEELMREGGDAVARGPVERLVRRATEPNRHLRLHRCLPVPSHAAAPPSLFPVAVATADNLRVNPVSYAVELVSAAKGKVNMEYMRLVVDLMVKRGRPKLRDGWYFSEATFGDGILAKPQPEDGKISIFSIIWAVKEDLESTAHDTMGPLRWVAICSIFSGSPVCSQRETGHRPFFGKQEKKMLEPAAISLNKIVLNHYMENGTPTFTASLQQINAARASTKFYTQHPKIYTIIYNLSPVPTYRRFSPLPTYRHLSSHSPAPAHRVGKPRRAEVEELLGRHGDELPGGTGRCLSVNPLTTPPPLEIRHWGDGRRRRDPRAVVAGNGCGHRRADGREARSWRAAVAVVDGLMGGRSATAAVARSWWAPDDSHAWRHGSLFL
uniref:Uncharacterized protein n=1 Tax=Oryza barthii TaxID=65489 RepID=A0A0D3FNF1_9ORYZ